jgi:hypothetical protein
MKLNFLYLCMTICIFGCKSTPLHEIDYTGQLPGDVPASFTVAKEFATDLAKAAVETNLKIVSEDPMEWARGKYDEKGIVDLRTKEKLSSTGKGNVSVHIATHEAPAHEIYILIYGDIDLPEARVIAAKAEEIFVRKYPGFKLVRFTRYQGLGP